MINLFIDYLNVLFDRINNYTINNLSIQQNKLENKNFTLGKKGSKTANFNESLINKDIEKEHIDTYINEIKAVFILLQNFMFNNKEKENLFCKIFFN